MRILLRTLVLLTLSAGMVYAQQTGSTPQSAMKKPMSPAMSKASAAVDDALLANEHAIFAAIEKHDAAAFNALVAADAWSADANGFMKVSDFVPMIPKITMSDWKLNDPHVTHVDANTAIVTYTFTGTGSMEGQPPSSTPTYAATVWAKRGGKWLAVYHQETTAAPKK